MPKTSKRTDEYKNIFGNNHQVVGEPTKRVEWTSVPADDIQSLIGAVTSRGGAVRFGYTRDGQALALGLYYGTESVTKYCRPTEDLSLFLQVWTEFYLRLPDVEGVSPARQ